MSKSLTSALLQVQAELKAPKNQRNKFGNYNYRSAEDILEAVKPLLSKHGLSMHITDEVMEVGGITFINSTVIVSNGEEKVYASAQAGIDVNRKGMDIAQSFGSSSSYARKYAMNGMFLIDDTKDADATNTHGKSTTTTTAPKQSDANVFQQSVEYIKGAKTKQAKELAYKQVLGKYGDNFSASQKQALSKFVG